MFIQLKLFICRSSWLKLKQILGKDKKRLWRVINTRCQSRFFGNTEESRAGKALWQKLHRLPVERLLGLLSLLLARWQTQFTVPPWLLGNHNKSRRPKFIFKGWCWSWNTLAGVLGWVFTLRMKWLWLATLGWRAILATSNLKMKWNLVST